MMANRAVPGLPEKVFPAIMNTGAGFLEIPGASRESMTGMWPQKIRSRRDKNMPGKVREALSPDARKPLRGKGKRAKRVRGNGGPENRWQVIEILDLPASRAVLSSYGGERGRDEPSSPPPGRGDARPERTEKKSKPKNEEAMSQTEAQGKDVQASIFAEAEAIINGPRARDYGDARLSFKQIADLWSAYLQRIVTPTDVAVMMALLKLVRLKYSGFTHHDSFVDMLGYVGLAHKVAGAK